MSSGELAAARWSEKCCMTELLVLNVAQKVTRAVSLDGSRVRTLVDSIDELPDTACRVPRSLQDPSDLASDSGAHSGWQHRQRIGGAEATAPVCRPR